MPSATNLGKYLNQLISADKQKGLIQYIQKKDVKINSFLEISGYYFLVDFLEIVLLVIDTDLCENGRGTKVFAEEVDFPAGIK